MMAIKVSEIHIYPVKSCKGIALSSAWLDARGLRFDREWMIIDDHNRFMTQRNNPTMALIETALSNTGLRLTLPDSSFVDISLTLPPIDQRIVEVWGDQCQAIDQGEAAAQFLSQFLEKPCRLVRMAATWVRTVDQNFAPPGSQTAFSDGYPLLGISEASLADFNARLPQPVPMNRFRPNLVFSGSDAYAEDRWHTVRVGEIVFRGVKRCSRCRITSVNQSTGEFTSNLVLDTLAEYRKIDRGLVFGQNLVHVGSGQVHLGAPVQVIVESDLP
ncbi:MAG: MOSC N-terminal beta barrel domain-containing protein [Anaerolineae bacterium]|nr:MOSC N-terminal beta barrel domain-containing protein [Gloeobacterales cyanobacterium ES-bin-313]